MTSIESTAREDSSVHSDPKPALSARTGRLDKRCHTVEWGNAFQEWFHAYAPSASDIANLNPDDVRTIHALVDKVILIGESSFADEGYQSAGEMPFDLFNAVCASIITSGQVVRPDGSCHK